MTEVAAGQLIRVGLVDCASLLGDLIRRTLADHPELRVVADVSSDRIRRALDADADVIVWQEHPDSPISEHANPFAVGTRPAIVAVEDDGSRSSVWRLCRCHTPLGELSPGGLVSAIIEAGQAARP